MTVDRCTLSAGNLHSDSDIHITKNLLEFLVHESINDGIHRRIREPDDLNNERHQAEIFVFYNIVKTVNVNRKERQPTQKEYQNNDNQHSNDSLLLLQRLCKVMGVPDRFPNPQFAGNFPVCKEHRSDWNTVKDNELNESMGLFQLGLSVMLNANIYHLQPWRLLGFFQTEGQSLDNQEWGGYCKGEDPNDDHDDHDSGGFLQVTRLHGMANGIVP